MDLLSLGANFNTNLNSEMSDLVHQAEEWAEPEHSKNRTVKLGQRILTRAAVLLLNQLGIKTVEEFQKHFGAVLEKEHSETPNQNLEQNVLSDYIEDQRAEMMRSPVSPMTLEEFKSVLSNSSLLEEPLPSPSPFGKRRTSMLAGLIPMSPIFSENSASPDKKTPTSILNCSRKSLFPITSTPKSQRKMQTEFLSKRSNSMPMAPPTTSKKKSPGIAPRSTASTPKLVLDGETPLENRASRLRRMKLEETLRSVNSSFNTSWH